MRETIIKGELTAENITMVPEKMPDAPAYAVEVPTVMFEEAKKIVDGLDTDVRFVVQENIMLPDDQWRVSCFKGTFFWTVPPVEKEATPQDQ